MNLFAVGLVMHENTPSHLFSEQNHETYQMFNTGALCLNLKFLLLLLSSSPADFIAVFPFSLWTSVIKVFGCFKRLAVLTIIVSRGLLEVLNAFG